MALSTRWCVPHSRRCIDSYNRMMAAWVDEVSSGSALAATPRIAHLM
jgi:hypothetical protein